MCNDEMKPKEKTYEPIAIMELEIEKKKKAWLTKYGWKERCDFVDSYWRWCKKIGKVMMMCDMGEAINIEYNCLES